MPVPRCHFSTASFQKKASSKTWNTVLTELCHSYHLEVAAANATKDLNQRECDGDQASTHSEESNNDPRSAKRSQSGTSILERISAMAGLASTCKDKKEKCKRDRASSVPIYRKACKRHITGDEPKLAIGCPTGGSGTTMIQRHRARSVANPAGQREGMVRACTDIIQKDKGESSGPATAPGADKNSGNGGSRWETFQRRRMRAMSIFSARGAYTAVPAN
jgi:hypothetical protein